jgi:magnesium-transporting ATPase (P-type)
MSLIQTRSLSIAMLDLISQIFSRYCLIALFILGTIGLVLNTFIFTRKTFRQNSCVHYFLASTIANYFVVFFILPSRVLSDGFNIDPGHYNLFYCKIRFYTYFTAKSLSSWFIVLACFDRKMSSSHDVHRRAFARPTISRWMIFTTTLIGLLFYAHVLIFYEIGENQQCDARAGVYRLFNDSVYLIGYSLAPPLLMLLFGIWTIANTRRLRRIVPRFGRRITPLNHRDHTLLFMLFLQVILITITVLPHAVQKLYSTLTLDVPKDDFRKAADNVFIIVVRTISFFNHSCTFYILTLSGKMFRQELFKLMKKFICKPRHQHTGTNQRLRTLTLTVVKFTGNNQQTTDRNT